MSFILPSFANEEPVNTIKKEEAVSLESLSKDLIGKRELNIKKEEIKPEEAAEEEVFLEEIDREKENKNKACKLTPDIKYDFITKVNVKKTSNLVKNPGSLYLARGKLILLKGQILDQNCVPVSNAVVKIFQADSNGFYEDYFLDKEKENKEEEEEKEEDKGEKKGDKKKDKIVYDSNFQYSGISYTNSLGEFTFMSVKPGKLKDAASHINLKVIHPDFRDIETRIYFSDNEKENSEDKELNELKKEEKDKVIAKKSLKGYEYLDGGIYNIKLILHGVNKHKTF